MKDNLRIAIVYTGMPVALVERVENEIKQALAGRPVTVLSLSDPGIIDEAQHSPKPTPNMARRLVTLYMTAVNQGADIVVNACSSVGDVAGAAVGLFEWMGVPLVRIDAQMAEEAVENYARIGVMATLPSTLEPTKRLLKATAAKLGRAPELVDALADGAFGVSAQRLGEILTEKALAVKERVDCYVLAQASMAGSAKTIEEATGRKTYASVGYAAREVARLARGL